MPQKDSKRWKMLMARARRKHPNWGLARRKAYVYAAYNRMK